MRWAVLAGVLVLASCAQPRDVEVDALELDVTEFYLTGEVERAQQGDPRISVRPSRKPQGLSGCSKAAGTFAVTAPEDADYDPPEIAGAAGFPGFLEGIVVTVRGRATRSEGGCELVLEGLEVDRSSVRTPSPRA